MKPIIYPHISDRLSICLHDHDNEDINKLNNIPQKRNETTIFI